MIGFRISIKDHPPQSSELHYSGGSPSDESRCLCPNCAGEMFPAFNLWAKDFRVISVIEWKHQFLRIFYCPHCSLHLKDYEITAAESGYRVDGGYRDGEKSNPHVDLPFTASAISLDPLPLEYPTNDYETRKAEDGIYHQLGGRPIWDSLAGDCTSCRNEMRFIGIMDYDDNSVPLFENGGEALAMVIGDMDCMNLYGCSKCSMIRYRRVKTP